MAVHAPRRTRLKHRIPVRLRHYWKTAAAAVVGALVLVLVFGANTVRPYITSSLVSKTTISHNIEGEGELFDDGEHAIEVSYNEAEYADMMQTFEDEGEKEFISADITIDGTLVEDVGLRLKGNSTLSSLRGEDGGPGGPGGMGMAQLSADKPEELPLLISFDEFEEGRAYQGHTELALRPASSDSDTALNEALALEMTARSGQTTQDFTFTTVTVNGGRAAARLLVDAPDPSWAESLGNGVLYKARAGGSFEYRGEDPTDYGESFNQINGEGSYDLQPVMDLLRFVEETDDEEFARELEDHLDVEAFAEYLATQELIKNSDAMDGPGNNYYLWYDTDEERFTVLSWDLNLALGGMDRLGMGDRGRVAGGDASTPPGDVEGVPELPEGVPELPEGGPGGDGGMRAGGSGKLKERFVENEKFNKLYEEAYADLHAELVDNGFAKDTVTVLVERARAVGDRGTKTVATALQKTISEITEDPPDPTSSRFGGPPRRE